MSAGRSTAERLAALERIDDRLVGEGRFVDVSFLVEVGSEQFLVTVKGGRVAAISGGPLVMPQWTFALRASSEEWDRFWQSSPPPGSNDLFAMLRRKTLRLEGDVRVFMANLLYFKALLASPRMGAAA